VAAWLQKPIRRAQLQSILSAAASPPRATEPAVTPRQAATANESTRVLLVEDNEVNQKVALRMLERCGIRAQLVSNGAEAVERVRNEAFDLVLMDCQMPVMDGYAATAAIRAFSKVPIVAMTANALAGDRERCLAAGMDDYVTKPIKREVLADVLERWVGSARLADLIDAYLADTPQQLERLAAAVTAQDSGAAQRLIRALTSSSRDVGADAVAQVAQALDPIASAAELHRMGHRIEALRAAFHVMVPKLQARAARIRGAARAGDTEAPLKFVKDSARARH
jgi:CheY-like chemotaxis protein